MDLQDFKESLSGAQPPGNVSEYIKALWYDANGNWDKAHNLVQDINDTKASWIHAYLHRREGDTSNADYWYSKAGKKRPLVSLEMEWEQIVNALLQRIKYKTNDIFRNKILVPNAFAVNLIEAKTILRVIIFNKNRFANNN